MEKAEIEIKGYRELVTDHCQLARRVQALAELETAQAEAVARLEERIAEVEYLVSEEIVMRNILRNIRRAQPSVPPNGDGATYTPATLAVDHGGAELTDIGLSYAEVDASLRRLTVTPERRGRRNKMLDPSYYDFLFDGDLARYTTAQMRCGLSVDDVIRLTSDPAGTPGDLRGCDESS